MSATSEEPTADALMQRVTAAFPDLAGLPCRILGSGFDSVALDVDDRLVFKFPRHAAAREALIREARLLAIVRPAVRLPVPALVLVDELQPFSRHEKIQGDHLLSADYAALPEPGKARLAADLAGFFAEIHALDPALMAQAGARPIKPWLAPDVILASLPAVLAPDLLDYAGDCLAQWRALPRDPLGETYGFFDGHGWNMAFDYSCGQLNGIYDFADSGFGGLHQEFIYPAFVAPDLTLRIIAEYEQLTERGIDRRRVHLLAAVLRLSELAEFAASGEGDVAAMADSVACWAALPQPR